MKKIKMFAIVGVLSLGFAIVPLSFSTGPMEASADNYESGYDTKVRCEAGRNMGWLADKHSNWKKHVRG